MAYVTGKSGNYTFQDNNKEFTWRVNWSEKYDIALNSSIVSIDSIELLSTAYNDIWWLNALVKINDETVAEMNYYTPPTHYVDFKNRNTYYPVIKYGSGKAFPFVSSPIAHNADGKKTITIAITANPAGHDIGTIQLVKDNAGEFKHFGSIKSATIELTHIPRAATLTAAPNFTDEDNPTITYSNPAGAAVDKLEACISLTGARADIAYREVSISGSSYTFNLTEAEREVLRQATLEGSTSRTVYFILQTTIAGVTYRSPLAKIFTVINAEPDFSALVMDLNETTAALTGDRLTRIIKGYSNAAYELSATPKKGASITGYRASNGSQAFTTDSGTFAATQSANFTFSATDNRGQTVSASRNLNLINYFKPTCNAEATLELDGETTARANIKISGTFFNASFGAVKNSLEILIKHSATDRWVSLTNELYFEPTTSGNTYTIDFGVSNLDYSKPFTYQCKVVDKLDFATSAEDTKSIYPVFDWSDSDFNINVPFGMNGNVILRHNQAANNLVIASSGGHIYIRPLGSSNTTGEIKITPQGNLELKGDIIINGVNLTTKLKNAGII